MTKTMPVALSTGLVSGIFFGISLKTGLDVDEFGIGFSVLQSFCEMDMLKSVSFCSNLWFWGIFLSFIGIATMIEDARINPLLYGAGLIFGFLIIILT